MNNYLKFLCGVLGAVVFTSAFAEVNTSGPDSPMTPAAMGQSKVMVYRADQGYYARFSPALVYLNGEKVASLRSNEHAVFCVASGEKKLGIHLEDAWIYTAKNLRTQFVNFDSGKTYILKVQDEERDRYAFLTDVPSKMMQLETGSSSNVKVLAENKNNIQIVPCISYVAPVVPIAPAVAPKPVAREVTLGADALFAFDRYGRDDLLPEGRAKLDALSNELRSVEVQRIHIVGYTDRLGNDAYNLRLSQYRAETVLAYLADKGISPTLMTTEGRGKNDPVQQCAVEGNSKNLIACLQPNRRVVLQIYAKK